MCLAEPGPIGFSCSEMTPSPWRGVGKCFGSRQTDGCLRVPSSSFNRQGAEGGRYAGDCRSWAENKAAFGPVLRFFATFRDASADDRLNDDAPICQSRRTIAAVYILRPALNMAIAERPAPIPKPMRLLIVRASSCDLLAVGRTVISRWPAAWRTRLPLSRRPWK